jgi:hypothetical protein
VLKFSNYCHCYEFTSDKKHFDVRGSEYKNQLSLALNEMCMEQFPLISLHPWIAFVNGKVWLEVVHIVRFRVGGNDVFLLERNYHHKRGMGKPP